MTAERRFSWKTQGEGKQPAHRRIQTVVGSEKRQRNPGPIVVHG